MGDVERVSSSSSLPRSCKESKRELRKQVDMRYAACQHRMVRKTALPGQSCGICSAHIWGVHKQSMRCMECGLLTHIKCLPNLKGLSSSADTMSAECNSSEDSSLRSEARDLSPRSPASPRTPSTCTSHVLQRVTLLKPTWCCVCEDFIWGLHNQGLTCMACGKHYHHKCGEGIATNSAVKLKKEADMQRKEYEDFGKSDASGVLKTLLCDFSKRWSTMDKVKLASPLGLINLKKVYSRHSKQYEHLPERFPRFTDAEHSEMCSIAMLYAKASYGVAYSNGHLSTVGSAFRMHTVLKPFKNVGADVTSRDNDVGAMQALDSLNSNREILMSVWSNKVYQPAFTLFVDHTGKLLVLSIRGTVSEQDTLTDLTAESTEFSCGEAHSGIVKCTDFIWSHTKLMEHLNNSHRSHPDYAVIATGHSLGAAVATLFSIKARESSIGGWADGISCYSFGSPPTVSGDVIEMLNSKELYITSIICGLDAVPRLSLKNLERLLREVSGVNESQLHEECPHTRLHIPGRLLLIHHPVRHGKPGQPVVYEMPQTVSTSHVSSTIERSLPPKKECKTTASETTHWAIARLYVSRHMFGDHLPDRYHDSLVRWSQSLAGAASPVASPRKAVEPQEREKVPEKKPEQSLTGE